MSITTTSTQDRGQLDSITPEVSMVLPLPEPPAPNPGACFLVLVITFYLRMRCLMENPSTLSAPPLTHEFYTSAQLAQCAFLRMILRRGYYQKQGKSKHIASYCLFEATVRKYQVSCWSCLSLALLQCWFILAV